MFKHLALIFAVALMLTACSTQGGAKEETRLDATTDKSATRSYQRMVDELPQDKKLELAMAMIAINLSGTTTASDVANNSALQGLSIARIRDRVAGMTADEIIAYAAMVSTVQIEVQSR